MRFAAKLSGWREHLANMMYKYVTLGKKIRGEISMATRRFALKSELVLSKLFKRGVHIISKVITWVQRNRGAPQVAGDTCKHNVQSCNMHAWNRGEVSVVIRHRGFALVEILVATLLGSAVIGGTFKVLEVSLQSSRVARSTLTEQELTVLVGNVLNDPTECQNNLKTSSADFTDIGSGNWRLAKLIKGTDTLIQTGQDFQNNLEIIDMQLQAGGSLDRRFTVFYKKKNMGNLNTLGGGANCSSSDTTDCYYAYCDLNYAPVPPSGTPTTCANPSCVYFNASGGGGGGNPECYKVTDNSGSPQEASLVGCGGTDQLNVDELVAFGFEAGKSTDDSGTLIGYQAGHSNDGYKTTFVGHQSGYRNDGGDNTFIGYKAGYRNDGGGNTFLGSSAGGDSFSSRTTGSDNVFIGYRAGYDNTSGGKNVFIGQWGSSDSGEMSTTGSSNIFIGKSTGLHGEGGIDKRESRQLNIGNLIYGRQPSSAPTTDFYSSSYLGSSDGVVINGKLYAEEHIEAKKHIAAAEYVKVGSTTASCTTSIAGALRYRSSQIEFCNGSAWTALGGSTPPLNSPCSASTYSNCVRSYTSHGGNSGSCASGYTGSCSYSCSNGAWSSVSNSCSSTTYSSCSASTVSNCVRSYSSHNGTSGTCRSGYTGNCSYRCNNGSWQYQSNSCSTTTYSSCSGRTVSNCVLSSRSHNGTSGNCRSRYSGSCSYRCNNGSWTQISNTCSYNPPPPPQSSCSASTTSDCVLSSTSSGGTSGSCATAYSGSCSYYCLNGSWLFQSNTCTALPTYCRGGNSSSCWLSGRSHGSTSGYCFSGYTGSCSYRCNYGSWDRVHNTCCGCSCSTTQSSCNGRKVYNGSCYWSGGSCKYRVANTPCFKSGTLVTMANGALKPIQAVQLEDQVLSKSGINTVLKLKIRSYKGQVYSINGSSHFVTGGHPFMTKEGWKAFDLDIAKSLNPDLHFVGTLKEGDVLIKEDGKEEVLVNYSSQIEETTVYNLQVDGDSTYYANGYLVHNK